MKTLNQGKQIPSKGVIAPGKQYSYHEIVDFLDTNWVDMQTATTACIKQLDKALGNLSKSVETILISGTNGKSLAVHFAAGLFKEEGLKVGAFFAPHILTYNEQISIDTESVSNKLFTEAGNEVLQAAATLDVKPTSADVLYMIALLCFKQSNVDIALFEVTQAHENHPLTICSPKIAGITRITEKEAPSAEQIAEATARILSITKKDTHVVSADQSKINLQVMQQVAEAAGGIWSMPIRKLAPLSYPFEQLHGRSAALAERIVQIYINTFLNKETVIIASNSLLAKTKGQRGRPTLEAKRQSELNPKRTIDQYWHETASDLPGRFQLLDKEKPSILLDTASNLDAFKNLLLGIRLLHYSRPLKGLTLIIGSDNPALEVPEFLKLLRYFFKKTSGQVVICPVVSTPGNTGIQSWNAEKITNDIKGMKIKAKSTNSFKDAFEFAQSTVDERHGLVVITGSPSIVSEYWRYKGMKKL